MESEDWFLELLKKIAHQHIDGQNLSQTRKWLDFIEHYQSLGLEIPVVVEFSTRSHFYGGLEIVYEYLLKHKNELVSHEQLQAEAWSSRPSYSAYSQTMSRLGRHIKENPDMGYLDNMKGKGYILRK